MADRVQSLSTIHPDFDTIVSELQNYLATRPVWKDKLRSSTGQFTLEVAGAIGELDQYSIERLMQDAFPETAKLDSAVYAAMKTLGTRIRRKIPGVTTLPLYTASVPGGPSAGETRLRRTNNSGTLIIPPMTQFTTSLGLVFNRETIKFVNGSYFAYQVGSNSDGSERRDPISFYQGTVEVRYFNMTGEDFVSIFSAENNFVIADEDVRMELGTGGDYVGLVPRQTIGLWNNKNNTPGWQDITNSDGSLHALFGSSVYGTIPAAGQLCTMTYAITKGANGNGVFPTFKTSCASFPIIDSTYDVFVSVEGDSSATLISGGTDEINADLYRKLGSQLYAADQGNKAIIQQDYSAIIKDYVGVSDALVLGQEDLDPSDLRYMNVAKIITYPKNLSHAAFQDLLSYVNKRSMMSMNFYREENGFDGSPIEPIARIVNLRANVYCKQATDLIGVRDNYIGPGIYGVIDKEWTTTNNASTEASKINRKIALSDFINAIKKAHASVDYVQLLSPTLDVIAKPYIEGSSITQTTAINTFGFTSDTVLYYVVTMVNAEGETLPISPLTTVMIGGDTAHSPLIRITVPPNFQDSQNGNYVWNYLNIYRGTSLDNMELLNVPWADWTSLDVSNTQYYLVDSNYPVVSGILPPVTDTTKNWVVNLPSDWTVADNIFMFNSERSYVPGI